MKLISIVIPHYNDWKRLEQLLKQIGTRNLLEIIVIDDHSNNSEIYFNNIKQKFPNVIIEKNEVDKKGAGAARNKGLSLASGEWLLFIDSDDMLAHDYYEKIFNYIDTDYDLIYYTPTSTVVGSGESSQRHTAYKNLIYQYLENPSFKNEQRLRYKYEPPWSKLIRHSVIRNNEIKFEESMVSNDTVFSAKVGYYSDKILATKETFYIITEREGSLTKIINQDIYRERFNQWIKYVLFLRENLTNEEFKALNISMITQYINILKNKLGLESLIYITKKGANNKISFFDTRLLHPSFIYKKIKKRNDTKINGK